MSTPISVLLADDHRLARDAFRLLLSCVSGNGFKIVADVDNGQDAVTQCKVLRPDVALLDIEMGQLNGIEAARQIQELKHTKVVIVSMHNERNIILDALRAGAAAYLLKDDPAAELIRAVRLAQQGLCHVSPRVTRLLVDQCIHQESNGNNTVFSILSDREREVLRLLAEGQTAKQIAYKLNLSCKTIETHRHRIMERLRIHSVAELTKYALREGLVFVA